MERVPIRHPDLPATATDPVWVTPRAAEAWKTLGWLPWKKAAPKKPAPNKEKTK